MSRKSSGALALCWILLIAAQAVSAESLSLLLLDSQRSGIPGQAVELLDSSGNPTGEQGLTDADGRAVFEVVAGQRYRMRVYHNGGSYRTNRVRAGRQVVVRTQRSELRLRDSQNSGIPGQRVELLLANGDPTGVEGLTDASGVAGFDILPRYRHRFRVHHNGGAYTTSAVTYGGDLTVRTQRSELRLRASDNSGIPGQRVELLLENRDPTGVEGLTDASGVAGFEILPAYRHRFRVHHNGGAYTTSAVTYGGDRTVRTQRSELRLYDSQGTPLAGQRVELLLPDGAATGFAGATDAAGEIGFEILPGYAHRFGIYHNGGFYATGTLVYGEDIQVQTARSELLLSDSEGNALSNLRVELLLPDGTATGFEGATDASGRIAFEILPEYAHRFGIHHNGGFYATGTLVYGEDIQVQTARSELILLDIVERPVVGAEVELWRGDDSDTGWRVLTDPEGRASFEILPEYVHKFAVVFDGQTHVTGALVYGEDAVLILPAPGLFLFVRKISVLYGSVVRVPVLLRGQVPPGLVAVETFVAYDRRVLTPMGVESQGHLSEGWVILNNAAPGSGAIDVLKIAAATDMAELSGPGTLFDIAFATTPVPQPATSDIALTHVLLNTGDLSPTVVDGQLVIVGHDGILRVSPQQLMPPATIEARVEDPDENRDDLAVETVVVSLDNDGQQESVVAVETAPTSGVFVGAIAAELGVPLAGDGVVQVQGGDAIELCYDDVLDARGNSVQRCDRVQVRLGRDARLRATLVSQPGDTLWVRLIDGDLNLDPQGVETALVHGIHLRTSELEDVLLTERSVDDSVFFGFVQTRSSRRQRASQNGIFWTRRGDELRFEFEDQATALGPPQTRRQDHRVVGLFGDADGDNRLRSADQQLILQHALGLVTLSGLDSLAANVDAEAPFSPITPADAALVLQRRQGQISRFPVQASTAANHPQLHSGAGKGVVEQRLLTLKRGDGRLALRIDEREAVTSGELLLQGVTGRVEAAAPGFGAVGRESEEGLRIVFAGARPARGPGALVYIFPEQATERIEVASARLNDGRIGVRLEGGTARTVALYANWPNPFNPETAIRFDLAQGGAVRLEVFDTLGQKVKTLMAESRPAGAHRVVWRGVDERGVGVSSGVYFYRLQAGDFSQMRRMLLLK